MAVSDHYQAIGEVTTVTETTATGTVTENWNENENENEDKNKNESERESKTGHSDRQSIDRSDVLLLLDQLVGLE